MSTRIFLYGYKQSSSGLRALQSSIKERGFKAIRSGIPRSDDVVLVWGNSNLPNWSCNYHINTPDKVSIAINKLTALQKFAEHNVICPEFTTDVEEAKTWLPKHYVVCRTLLRSSGGKGAILAKNENEVVAAPLYTKYKRKDKEYRVHVFKGEIIDTQEKRRVGKSHRPATYNEYIRNHSTGWVFCRGGLRIPIGLHELALSAITALELDFGAVDIIHNSKHQKSYVLEVNTAPGLEGTTLTKYVDAILNED